MYFMCYYEQVILVYRRCWDSSSTWKPEHFDDSQTRPLFLRQGSSPQSCRPWEVKKMIVQLEWNYCFFFNLIWKIENKADFRVLEILIRLAFRLHPLGCILWFQKIYNPIIVNYFKLGKCRTMTSSACTALCGIMRLAAPANAAFKSLSDIRAEYLKLKLKVRSLPRPTPGIATAISI